ncbi:regulator of G-protein signaling 22 [Diretmus argenteus]
MTELPHLTAGNFEQYLASDDILLQFFNEFLCLPSFPEALLYNQETGVFEVASEAAECVSRRIKSVLHSSKSQLLTNDPTSLARSPLIDNRYTVYCLDRGQGIQWIMTERFPLFIQSDCYFEYRLAKLMSQWEPNLCIQKWDGSAQRVPSSGQEGEGKTINPTSCTSSGCYSCSPDPSEEPRSLSGPSAGSSEDQRLRDSDTQSSESNDVPLEKLAAKVVKQVLKDAVETMNGCSRTNTSDSFSRSRDGVTAFTNADGSFKGQVCPYSAVEGRGRERPEEEKERGQEGKKKGRGEGERAEGNEEKSKGVRSGGSDEENAPDVCYHGACFHGSRRGLNEFKEFLRGTSGEKLLHLWMDIERLKATQHREQKNRHLVLMRGRYLLSRSGSSLHVELLSRLGLTTSPCWTEEKLHLVQPNLTEALLYYWAPRFWTSQCVQEDGDDSTLWLWTDRHLRPPSGIDPYPRCVPLPPARPDTCLPRSTHTARTKLCSSSSSHPALGSRRMERMLQALFADSRAGLYFTHFCEQSGNQLWENAVRFWTDLQHYHQLFYQDGLDPYTAQRHAQLLYSTYLSSSAGRSVGVDEEVRREVYDRLMPAFEELFDGVEEHTLTLLLEPWTLLVARDTESYQKVCVQEEVRQVASQEYRELQSLHEESELRLRQVEQYKSTPPPPPHPPSDGTQEPDPWSNTAPCYRGYRLGSLLRHRQEIRHFLSFLQDQDASIHLTCWLDLDQYRMTPQKDKAVRQERSSLITTKYLNRKYFFGPDSPASAEQQNDIMRLAGGPERLKLERLSNSVVVEIQNIVRSHIEKTWLPLFLSTAEFTERQKHKVGPRAADRLSEQVYRRRRKRRQTWKTDGLWMSSSKEILLFRRILLNPVTCLQFQHFVAMKGDFLENDVLFWLEVQRYKDLCHSHSDEATIQQKISIIISCFINSSMLPALQIDIPPEQAQHILENRHELGPYVFREAQMTVFGELLKLWPQFQALRMSLQEEQLLPLLEEKRVKHRARLQRRRRREEEEEERRVAQEERKKQESSFTEEEEEEDDVDGEREGRREKELTSRQSTTLYSPTQQMSWSYSKYMAALKREEVLLRRQSQPGASSSRGSDSSSGRSLKSAISKK